MAGTEISLSAEALDRMQKLTRARERARIANMIEEVASSEELTAGRLYALAEELRTIGVPVRIPPELNDLNGEQKLKGEIDDLTGGLPVIAHDPSSGLDELPEEHHMSDEDMALAMVRNRGVRGITQGMRD